MRRVGWIVEARDRQLDRPTVIEAREGQRQVALDDQPEGSVAVWHHSASHASNIKGSQRRATGRTRLEMTGFDGSWHLARPPRSAPFRIHFSGTLVRQDELAASLGAGDAGSAHDLIEAGWAKWGSAVADRLDGEFAIVIEEPARSTIILARDPGGIQPLYVAVDDDNVLHFGTTLERVLARLHREPPLNRKVLADYLADDVASWVTRTVYSGVMRLPRGSTLVLSAGAAPAWRRRAWPGGTVEAGVPASYGWDDQAWVDHFRAVLTASVADRMRGRCRIGVFTGGGVDSSALAAIARRLAGPGVEVSLIALVFERTPEADESGYLRALADETGATVVRVPGDDGVFLEQTPLAASSSEPPLYALTGLTRRLLAAARDQRCDVVLVGEGGDALLGLGAYGQPETIVDLGLPDLVRELPFYRIRGGKGALAALVNGYGRTLVRKVGAGRALRRLTARAVPAWLRAPNSDEEATSTEVVLGALPAEPRFAKAATATGRAAADTLAWPSIQMFLREWVEGGQAFGLTLSFPYLDARVIECTVRAPRRLIAWRGRDRILLRESMTSLVPARIAARTAKASFQALVGRGFHPKAYWAPWVCDMLLANYSFIDGPVFQAAVEREWMRPGGPSKVVQRALLAEAWLRLRDQGD